MSVISRPAALRAPEPEAYEAASAATHSSRRDALARKLASAAANRLPRWLPPQHLLVLVLVTTSLLWLNWALPRFERMLVPLPGEPKAGPSAFAGSPPRPLSSQHSPTRGGNEPKRNKPSLYEWADPGKESVSSQEASLSGAHSSAAGAATTTTAVTTQAFAPSFFVPPNPHPAFRGLFEKLKQDPQAATGASIFDLAVYGSESIPASVPLLVIGIPSVYRKSGADYLTRTLRYIAGNCAQQQQEQTSGSGGTTHRRRHWFTDLPGFDPSRHLLHDCLAPGPNPLRIKVIVVNNVRPSSGDRHLNWESARQMTCGGKAEGVGEVEAGPRCQRDTFKGEYAEAGEYQHAAYWPKDWHASSSASNQDDASIDEAHSKAGWPLGMVAFVHNGRPFISDGDDDGDPNQPGMRVRRQTRDVADLLDIASHYISISSSPSGAGNADVSFMFMEDDFRLCPKALEGLAYMLNKLKHQRYYYSNQQQQGVGSDTSVPHPAHNWNAIRVSLGLNGGILRAADIPLLAGYMREHVKRRPPDHMFVEWFAGEKPQSHQHKAGRPHAAFRYNILEHFGFSSSLRAKTSPIYAYCYDELDSGVVFEVEAFRPLECGHEDVQPCPRPDWVMAGSRQQVGAAVKAVPGGIGGPKGGPPKVLLDQQEQGLLFSSSKAADDDADGDIRHEIDFAALVLNARKDTVQTWPASR